MNSAELRLRFPGVQPSWEKFEQERVGYGEPQLCGSCAVCLTSFFPALAEMAEKFLGNRPKTAARFRKHYRMAVAFE